MHGGFGLARLYQLLSGFVRTRAQKQVATALAGAVVCLVTIRVPDIPAIYICGQWEALVVIFVVIWGSEGTLQVAQPAPGA